MHAVFSLTKDYRTTIRHCRELERNIKAEKHKMTGYALTIFEYTGICIVVVFVHCWLFTCICTEFENFYVQLLTTCHLQHVYL